MNAAHVSARRMREPLALTRVASDLPDPLASAIRGFDIDAVWSAISDPARGEKATPRAFVLVSSEAVVSRDRPATWSLDSSSSRSLPGRRSRAFADRGCERRCLAVALRDELTRIIAGFDQGRAGLVARADGTSIGVNARTAAVGVGASKPRGRSFRARGHDPNDHAASVVRA